MNKLIIKKLFLKNKKSIKKKSNYCIKIKVIIRWENSIRKNKDKTKTS